MRNYTSPAATIHHGANRLWTARKPGALLRDLAFSPDGSLLAVSHDAGISLLDAAAGQHRLTIPMKPAHWKGKVPVNPNWSSSLTFSPDGSMLASCTTSGHVVLHEVSSGKEMLFAPGKSWLRAVSFVNGRLMSTGVDLETNGERICLHDASSGKKVASVKTHDRVFARQVAISPKGNRAAVETGDHHFRLLDIQAQKQVAQVEDQCADVLRFSPDGKTLAVGYMGSKYSIYDAKTGKKTVSVKTW